MNKILAVVRASTEQQEVESQQAELKEFCEKLGYNEIEWIAVAGASARKANEKYLEMLDNIKNTIIAKDIKAVAFWHLNRLGRKESYIMSMKEWFVSNKIQVFVKNPTLTLLKEDGTLDAGANIAWSVFASMVAYDTEELFEKTKRGKERNKQQGKSVGGQVHYGYRLNKDKFVEIDWKNEAQKVITIYEEYATGNWSVRKLIEELDSRGIRARKDRPFNCTSIFAILKNAKYKEIVGEELFNKVQVQLADKGKVEKGKKRVNLGVKIVKCKICGANYITFGHTYACNHYANPLVGSSRCKSPMMSRDIMDNLLWDIASKIHIVYMNNFDQSQQEKLDKDIAILKLKNTELDEKYDKIDKAKDRLNDLYVDGMITKKKYEDKKITLGQQEALINEESERITSEMDRLSDLMENLMNPDKVPLLKDVLNSTPEQKQNIVKKHISKVFIDFQGKDKIIEVHIRGGEVRKYLYKYQKNLPPTEIK